MARKKLKENEPQEDDRLLYQVLAGDIRESKADQWRISNYGLLAQAAVASISHPLTENLTSGYAIILITVLFNLSILICWAAIHFIHEARDRIKDCRKITEDYPLPYKDPDKPPDPDRDIPILTLFRWAQVIGSDTAIIYIFSVT